MNHSSQFYHRQLNIKGFDVIISDIGSKKVYNKLKNFKHGDEEVERDYPWFVNWLIESVEQTKVIRSEDQNENENENEDDNVDENDKDTQYRVFLENLTENGKSYKLKLSQNNEELRYLYYEEPNNTDWCDELQTSIDNSGDDVFEDSQNNQKAKRKVNEKNNAISTTKEVSRRKKIDDHKCIIQAHRGMNMESSYQMYPHFEHGPVKIEEDLGEFENSVKPSDSGSDIMILDDVQNCSEVNNKQLVLAEKESSLREKLMHILEQPFNEKEYEELSEYIKQKKPICRLLDLRGRTISSALNRMRKSLLDYAPKDFQQMLNAAQNDTPRALNLLRMFCFWLEHVPNKDVFAPWKDQHILKVRPSEKKALRMPLMDK